MPDWVREHIAEIALLIYIFYPLLKRWWDRRKRKREEARARKEAAAPDAGAAAPSEKRTRARARATARRKSVRAKKSAGPRRPKPGAPPSRPSPPSPPPLDYLEAARARLRRVKQEAARLLEQARSNPRLARLTPALSEDLLGRIEAVERSLDKNPTISTVLQETQVIQALEELLRYLAAMTRQRSFGASSFLADADAIADACYAPILEFARAQGLSLRTSQPMAVTGDWNLSIVPRFASTRVAPLRLPAGFERSVWLWPAIAHEVAHDFFFSLETMSRDLHVRLGLPTEVPVPTSEAELDGGWLRGLFGAWLPEVFADLLGTLMLGPAYVETMRRAFRNPGSPQRTAAIMQDGARIDGHPPERLRVYMATRVLHHLGRHEEAEATWATWQAEHEDAGFYFFPLGGQWVGLSDEALHSAADSIVDTLMQRPWPELEGFHLQNIPGLAYLHAEHATVERLVRPLGRGERVDADPRWIVAAAVLAATAQPTLHDSILEAALQSIRGVGEERRAHEPLPTRRAPTGTIRETLVSSLRNPEAIREAIVVGAALAPYRRPRWR